MHSNCESMDIQSPTELWKKNNYGNIYLYITIHSISSVQYNTIQSVHTFHSIAFHSIPLQFITVHYIILYCMHAYIVQVSFPPDGYDLTVLQQVCRTCTRRSNTVCSMTACCDCSLTWIGIDGCLDFWTSIHEPLGVLLKRRSYRVASSVSTHDLNNDLACWSLFVGQRGEDLNNDLACWS